MEWSLAPKVASYIEGQLQKPLDKEVWSCLWAECHRPSLKRKVALTPEIDAKMAPFLGKFVRDSKKGINCSWRSCHGKLLDVVGPLSKILDMAKDARASGSLASPEALSSWAQRAIIFLGNASCASSTQWCRYLLIQIDQKLWELSTS